MSDTLQTNRNSLILWTTAAWLLFHGLLAIALPQQFAPVSTLCIVLAELAALFSCIQTSQTAGRAMRTRWWLLASAILFHAVAMLLDMRARLMGALESNPTPGLQILFSTLYGVPLLLAVSMQFDPRAFRPIRIVNAFLSLALAALFYVQVFSVVTLHGSGNPGDILFISHLFDALDLFLAIAATIRAIGAGQSQERRFFYVASLFLWANTILPAIRNRLLPSHNLVVLDLLIAAPYILLLTLTSLRPPLFVAEPDSTGRFTRIVRSGSPIFLSLGLLLLGISVSRTHFYIGAIAVLASIIGYGTLNTLTQSRGIEAEESLLAAKRNLEELVAVDDLTGIPNRRAFDRAIDRECSAANRSMHPLSLLMIDVDFFKHLNDTSGHLTGDDYLIRIAHTLQDALPRITDFTARYGGEEFAVILPGTNCPGAMEVARKLHLAIANLALTHPTTPSGLVTVSIGISTYNGLTPPSPFHLTNAADRALYNAKDHGRNRSEFLPCHETDSHRSPDRPTPISRPDHRISASGNGNRVA